MATVVAPYSEGATSQTGQSFTAPAGITGMSGLILLATGSSTAVTFTLASAGATFTQLDIQTAGSERVAVFSVTGLAAGATVTCTLSATATLSVAQIYSSDYTFPTTIAAGVIRAASVATCVSNSVTPTAGQRVFVLSTERTTTATTVTSMVSSGGETVTQDIYGEGATVQSSVLIGHFDASAAAARTVTTTYSNNSANGYSVLVPATAVVAGGGTGAVPAYAASGAYDKQTAANTACAYPTGVAVDDILVAIMYTESAGLTVTPPAGWAQISAEVATSGSTNFQATKWWWKRAVGGETGTATFTHANAYRVAQMHRFTGCINTGNPFDSPGGSSSAGATATSANAPAVSDTTAGPDRLLVYFGTCWDSPTSWTPPTGFTEQSDSTAEVGSVSTKAQATAGATGSVSGTVNTVTSAISRMLMLVPTSSGAVGPESSRFLLVAA